MKLLQAACFLVILTPLAYAQSTVQTDDTTKVPPVEPVLASQHSGAGRIGVVLGVDTDTGLPIITALIRGGPAEDFGFRVGDIIIRIDKNMTSTLSKDEVDLALHGDPGTPVELAVERDGNPDLIVRALDRRIIPAGSIVSIRPPTDEVTVP
jgi:C-terminal processing protease CtpA/Prc